MSHSVADRHMEVPALAQKLLSRAGVEVNGSNPWDMQVHDPIVFRRVLTQGSLGLGESYMDGQWDCDQLDNFFCRMLSVGADREVKSKGSLRLQMMVTLDRWRRRLQNLQHRGRAFRVGEHHYDTGFDVFSHMLDSRLNYSCGYWETAENLEQAQLNKLDLVCRKLQLKEGETLVDIGCGWGGLARYAAEKYGVEVTGITVSRDQHRVASERCQGLPVKIELMDYRDLQGKFEKAVSIGMFEHVGPRNYAEYFRKVNDMLKPQGLFLLHSIGWFSTSDTPDPWTDKYIFPNGHLPSASRITRAIEPNLHLLDWHNFGPDYDPTLMAWWHNFDANWFKLKEKYSERFYRMWRYYLHSCAGMFRAGNGQLWQIVMARVGEQLGYRSVR